MGWDTSPKRGVAVLVSAHEQGRVAEDDREAMARGFLARAFEGQSLAELNASNMRFRSHEEGKLSR